MSISVHPGDFSHLSIADRMLLIDRIWESIATQTVTLPLTDEQREELDCRIEDLDQNPGNGELWEDLKKRLLSEL